MHPDDHASFLVFDPRLYVPFIGAPTNFNEGKQRAIRQNAAQAAAATTNGNNNGVVANPAQAVPVPSNRSRPAIW